MNADLYLSEILRREQVAHGVGSPALAVLENVRPIIAQWAGNKLVGVFPSGSYAKGTANKSGTDIDIFISLSSETTETLKEIYEKLFNRANDLGYGPKRQNVSINVKVNGLDIDLVPGRRQDTTTTYHSLYRRKADTWIQTNVQQHIAYVLQGNRLRETRILKLWRNQQKLDLPSFYLEMVVIEALRGSQGTLSQNVVKALTYLRDTFMTARFVDPANTNNVISDDLTIIERSAIASRASMALTKSWGDVVT
jgi:predicted nucleotidyltransferase